MRIVLPTKRACRQFAEALKRQATTPILFPQMYTLTEALSTTEQGEDDLPRLLRFFSFFYEFLRERRLSPLPCTLFASLPALIALLEEAFLYEISEPSAGLLSEKAELFWALYKAISQSSELMATLKSAQRFATLRGIETQIHTYPEDPVVLAGITAIFPKILAVFQLVGKSAHNMVVLPEIMPNPGKSLTPEHPQYALHTILGALACSPEEVIPLGGNRDRRKGFVLQALTEGKSSKDASSAELPDHVTLIEAAHAQEEAFIIALLFRESFATPSQTAALITPDPDLVQRVEEHLKRWNLTADISQARSLALSSAGVFALLCADVIEENFADAPLLALLKHPFSFLPLEVAWKLEHNLRCGVLTSLLEETS
ncbi:MAG: hypothetical protein LBD15_00350, partial [Holosporales bacterium]|nr:hypothetical protein [Holosporales bacterium]